VSGFDGLAALLDLGVGAALVYVVVLMLRHQASESEKARAHNAERIDAMSDVWQAQHLAEIEELRAITAALGAVSETIRTHAEKDAADHAEFRARLDDRLAG